MEEWDCRLVPLKEDEDPRVAPLAHELSHYLTATAPEAPFAGYHNWEFATEFTATFLGFGVFMANSAFNFRQYAEVDSQGWSYSRSGYLTEAEHNFALAIFLLLKKYHSNEHLLFKIKLEKTVKKIAKRAC